MQLAFLFPGQGSQSVGMLTPWLQEPLVLNTLAEASEALQYDLLDVIQSGPSEKLNETAVTQPAILAVSVALWRLWQSQTDIQPSFMAGHSLGEYSALVCAGAIHFQDAVQLVRRRGECMQAAVPEGVGAMAALLGIAPDAAKQVCEEATRSTGKRVVAANFNSKEQTVISGEKSAVEKAIELAKAAGAKRGILLPVSVPSHSPLMEKAAAAFAADLDALQIQTPRISVINNVDVKIETDPTAIKQALHRQLTQSVRWVETVEALVAAGVTNAVECGPGKVLSGLVKKIHEGLDCQPLTDKSALAAILEKVNDIHG